MKRSEINEYIQYAIDVMKKANYPMPPFAYYSVDDWKNLEEDQEELVENMLGWDVTDFGSGDFDKIGLTIFTYRNGNFFNQEKYPKIYAEKLLLVRDGQILPFHYHWSKMEDIINRGGGDLAVTLYNCLPDDFADQEGGLAGKPVEFADTDVTVTIDGRKVTVPAGGKVIMKPGQSITLLPGQYHSWQGVPGTGDVILFEVSARNDDTCDNRFFKASERIPELVEDAEPEHLIFADYPKYTKFTFGKKN